MAGARCLWGRGSGAVSYTHLDVYKRQLQSSPPPQSPPPSPPVLPPAQGSLHVQVVPYDCSSPQTPQLSPPPSLQLPPPSPPPPPLLPPQAPLSAQELSHWIVPQPSSQGSPA